MNKYILNKFNSHQSQINLKANLDTLSMKENKLLEKIYQVSQMLKKFEAETATLFNDLENKLNNLLNIKVDDVMLTKKPLGGYSCASCDKNIQDLQIAQQTRYGKF